MSSSDFQAWLNAAGRVPLLTHAEEIILGRQVQAAAGINPASKRPADRRLLRRAHRARERLATANLRLVAQVAQRYRSTVPPHGFVDLLQAGAEGVLHAAGKFDPSKGYKFSTYAACWIRQRIQVELDKNSRTIRAPSTITPALRRLPRAQQVLFHQLGRAPTPAELGQELGLSEGEVALAMQRTRSLASLDAPTLDGEGSSLGELLACPGEEQEDQQLDQLREAMAKLPALQRRLVAAAYLPDGLTWSQQVRAEGLSNTHARALLEVAMVQLQQLRQPAEVQLRLLVLAPDERGHHRRRGGQHRGRKAREQPGQLLLFPSGLHHGRTDRRATSQL